MENVTGGASQPTLSVDEALAVLANGHCRAVLLFVREWTEDAVPLEMLAAVLADGDVVPDGDPERLAVRLHHATVPKLADVGLAEYDPRSGSVRFYGHPLVEACLDCIAGVGG